MYTDILSKLDLAKNESKIYETLLRDGESSVGAISRRAGINRRNVYDSLNRLSEKGLIFEIRAHNENLYKAVEPRKLMEIVDEKKRALESILPDLEGLYASQPHKDEVFIYRGLEGWRNYRRDIIRIGEDVYTLGGNGNWGNKKIETFFDQFLKDLKKADITTHIIFDHEVKEGDHPILKRIPDPYKFLPKEFSTPGIIEAFGDHVGIFSHTEGGGIDEHASFTVIVNEHIAESVRVWIKYFWNSLS